MKNYSDNKQKYMQRVIYSLLLFILYWLYGAREVVAEPWQWADDGLYLHQAEEILRWVNGTQQQWLGAYNATLLSKTPFFALFLALTKIFCIPLRLAEFSLFLMLPFLFRRAINQFLSIKFTEFCILTIILVGLPIMPLEVSLARSSLQIFLSSLCLIGVIGFLFRINEGFKNQSLWAFITGLGFSLAYLNREESLWLLPAVSIAGKAEFFYNLKKYKKLQSLPLLVVLISTILAPILFVSLLNYKSYGVFFTTDRRAPQMTRAYKILSSLEPATREKYVPIKTDIRLLAYKISPTFASLSSYLEGSQSDGIACSEAHHILNDKQGGPREFFASTFEFALRDAAYANGSITAPEMEKTFKKIADELILGITQGKIKSGSSSIGICGAPIKGDAIRILQATTLSLYNLYTVMGMHPQLGKCSSGDPKDLYRMAWMTQSASAPTQEFSMAITKNPLRYFRIKTLEILNMFDELFYIINLIALFVGMYLIVIQKKTREVENIALLIGFLLLGSLFSFALIMGILHTLGFPILKYGGSYNAYGFAPLSVLSVYGFCFLKILVMPCFNKCIKLWLK